MALPAQTPKDGGDFFLGSHGGCQALTRGVLSQLKSPSLHLPCTCSAPGRFGIPDICPCGLESLPSGGWHVERRCTKTAGEPCRACPSSGQLGCACPMSGKVLFSFIKSQGLQQTPATGVSQEAQACSSETLWFCLCGWSSVRAAGWGQAPSCPMVQP